MSTKENKTENSADKTTVAKVAKAPKEKKVKEKKVSDGKEHRGRKSNPSSARQLRLARFAERAANGEKVGRGRPKKAIDPNAPVKQKKVKVAKPAKPSKATKKVSEEQAVAAKA